MRLESLGLVKNIRFVEVEGHAFVSDVQGHERWGRHKEQLSGIRCADSGLYKIPKPLDLMNMRNMCLLSEEISAFLDHSCFCDPSVVSGFRYQMQKVSSGDTDGLVGAVTQLSRKQRG